MQIFLVLALVIAVVAVVFAVQNVAVVSISFFIWNAQVSLAIALLLALAAGVVITLLLSLPGRIKGSWNSASNKKKYANLETERDQLKARIEDVSSDRDKQRKKLEGSEKEIADLEGQLASLSAALQEAEMKSGKLPLPAADNANPGEPSPQRH